LAGVPRGRSIPLAKGGVNTPPAERDPRKIFDFAGDLFHLVISSIKILAGIVDYQLKTMIKYHVS
jgi:hypothetical protein